MSKGYPEVKAPNPPVMVVAYGLQGSLSYTM